MKRRIISLLTALALCLTLLPVSAQADITDWSDPSGQGNASLQKGWSADGSYDISWYTEAEQDVTSFTLYDAADLAGLAVLVNGSYDVTGDEVWNEVEATLGDATVEEDTSGNPILKSTFAGMTITLAAGVTFDLSGHLWIPIGYRGTFQGTFDGNSQNGTTITGMVVQSESGSAGLFGQARCATIQNVAVENASITAKLSLHNAVGGIVGWAEGDASDSGSSCVKNCSFAGTIEIQSAGIDTYAGGIVGSSGCSSSTVYDDCLVDDCVNYAAITGRAAYTGGIVGWNGGDAANGKDNTIQNCQNYGEITLSGGTYLGGIVGSTQGTVKDCQNYGKLSSTGQTTIGGVAGRMRYCTISDCTNKGAITQNHVDTTGSGAAGGNEGDGSIQPGVDEGSGSSIHSVHAGGIVGIAEVYGKDETLVIENCHNRGNITSTSTSTSTSANETGAYVGGVLCQVLLMGTGTYSIFVTQCSNTGALSARGNCWSSAGGLAEDTTQMCTFDQCYNAGKVTAATQGNYTAAYSSAGGLASKGGGNFTDCYNVGAVTCTAASNAPTRTAYAGGLVGYIDETSSFASCYNAGVVTCDGGTSGGSSEISFGGIVGKVASGVEVTVTTTDTTYWSGCVTGANTNYGAGKSANDMTEDYLWAANLGLDTSTWEKQANDLSDEDDLIGYLPVLQNNRQTPAPQLTRTAVADSVTVTISGAPEGLVYVSETPISLTAAVTGGTGSYSIYWTTSDPAVAEVTGSGTNNTTGTVSLKGPGNVTITAIAVQNGQNVGYGTVTLAVYSQPITAVTISGLTAPVQGETPVAAAAAPAEAYYMVASVTWKQGGSEFDGVFAINTVYTAEIVLAPKTNASFGEDSTIALDGITPGTYTYTADAAVGTGGALTVTVTFDALEHSHKWSSAWRSDGTGHWHACLNDDCDITDVTQIPSYMAHADPAQLWRVDAETGEHYLVCYTCGHAFAKAAHSDSENAWLMQGDQHWQVCDTCGERFNVGTHADEDGEWQYVEGGNTHYHVCDTCGAHMDEEEHKPTQQPNGRWYVDDATYHWQVCSACGAVYNKAEHQFQYDKSYLYHSWKCTCGKATIPYEKHKDADNNGYCDDCGGRIGLPITLNPNGGTFEDNTSAAKTVYTDTNGYLQNLPTPVKDGFVFLGWYTSNGLKVTETTELKSQYTLTAKWGTLHAVTVDAGITNGTVTAAPQTAAEGQTVTLTVTPVTNYRLQSITVTYGQAEITPTSQGDGTYTFSMPDANVTVTAVFEAIPEFYITNRPSSMAVGDTTTLTTTGGDGGTVTWESSASTVATVGATGEVTAVGVGQVTIKAKRGEKTDSVTFTVYGQPITEVTISGLTAPAKEGTPVFSVTVPTDANYTAGAVTWMDEEGNQVSGTFAPDTVYTAAVTLTPHEYYSFAQSVTIGGLTPTSQYLASDGSLVVTVTFAKTAHEHTYDDGTWTSDGTDHWHQCTDEYCPDKTGSITGKAAHSSNGGWVSDGAFHWKVCDTCKAQFANAVHSDPNRDGKCDTCGYGMGYTITFNAAGGTCAVASAYTGGDGYLPAGSWPTPTNGDLPFLGWFLADGTTQVNSNTKFTADTTVYAHWGEPTRYTVTVTAAEHGSVTADPLTAAAGENVTLTVTAEAGYELESLTAVCGNQTIPLSLQADGTYAFSMPAGAVTVSAAFREKGSKFIISGLPAEPIYVGRTFQLTASGGTGSGAVEWWSSTPSVAEVSANGTVTTKGPGAVTIYARRGGEEAQAAFTVRGADIGTVTILDLVAPVAGAEPVQKISVPDGANYAAMPAAGIEGPSSLDVIWTDANGTVSGSFAKGVAYTVTITLQADGGYFFAEEVSVTLDSIQSAAYESLDAAVQDDGTLKIIVTFCPTDHEHSYDDTWASSATHHWHPCLNEGCPLAPAGMEGYTNHTDNGAGVCEICGATIGYLVTFDPNEGECRTESARTDTYGKLAELPEAFRRGYTFYGWITAEGEPVTERTVFTEDTTVYASWTAIPDFDFSPSAPLTVWEVTVESCDHGTVAIWPEEAKMTTTITLTVTPDEGYELEGLTVTDGKGNALALTDKGGGVFTFLMPNSDVAIEAVFAAIQPDYTDCDGGWTCPLWNYVDAASRAWYHDGVHYCLANGLMDGTGANTFSPEGTTSRAMIATILWRLSGNPAAGGTPSFADVSAGSWYAQAVAWAAGAGIVTGYGDGTFAPDRAITREELAVMLYRFAQSRGMVMTAPERLSGYPDSDSVSAYAANAMNWAVYWGIIDGKDGALAPGAGATRAEAATMLMRFGTTME